MVILVIAASRSVLSNTFMNASTNVLNRREVLYGVTKIGFIAAIIIWIISEVSVNAAEPNSLKPPSSGSIPVAFVISEGAVVIDFCGPWEVFRDVMLPSGDHPFRLYTISDKTAPITAGGG